MKNEFLLSIGLALCSLPLPTFAAHIRTNDTVMASKPNPRSIREQAKQKRWEDFSRSRFTYDADLSQLYRSDLFGFSIRYPRGWKNEEILDRNGNVTTVALFLSPMEEDDTTQENVNVVVEDIVDSRLTLDTYTENAIRQERELFSGYNLHTSVRLQIAGYPAHIVSYDALFGGKNLSFEQVWILRDGKVYVWTLAAVPETFEKYSGSFRKMIDTFMFKP